MSDLVPKKDNGLQPENKIIFFSKNTRGKNRETNFPIPNIGI